MKTTDDNYGVVYSTDTGRMCPNCSNTIDQCSCKKNTQPLGDGNVRVQRETKGRGGKCVTVITGLPLNAQELKDLSKKLKARCGTGGTAKGGVIEIQGDHCDLLVEELKKKGFKAKRSGG